MPSLRKRVTSYFRQLSFHNEPREKRHNLNENSFITKYLQGLISLREGPPILCGKNPTDLPNFELGHYATGCESIIGCYTGPNGGLTAVKRNEKHLSVADPDIDFIDTQDETAATKQLEQKSQSTKHSGTKNRHHDHHHHHHHHHQHRKPLDNTTMVIRVAGQEYRVTTKQHKSHNKSRSLGSLSDLTLDSPPGTNDIKSPPGSVINENNNVVGIKKCSSTPEASATNNNNCSSVLNNNNLGSAENTKDTSATFSAKGNSAAENAPSSKNEDTQTNCDLGIGIASSSKVSSLNSSGATGLLYVGAVVDTERTLGGEGVASPSLGSARPPLPPPPSQNFGLAKSKSEGNPFQHKKKGKIIKIAQRTTSAAHATTAVDGSTAADDASLPPEWNRKCDKVYGISDSLYDKNQVTHIHNGDPIADCFGIIARDDSAILALADGVNWGEKAAVAAKSAIHGCLHYLNKTIFADTKPFESLRAEDAGGGDSSSSNPPTPSPGGPGHRPSVTDTKEVFVCLLRAFNCAHDLILENQGMLTTLTVAVVLPLKGGAAEGGCATYVCCVCNVGDTLAYVYSQKYGIRELTKGSHNINANRDMRDALGALGPVDGINPGLSNLTLAITTLQKGDIVLIASDGLTDNFDPNVCKFTVVNSSVINNNPQDKGSKDKSKQDSSNKQSSTKSRSSSRRDGKPPLILPSAPAPTAAAPPPATTATVKPPPPQKPPREKAASRRAAAAAAASRGSVDSTRSSQRSASGGGEAGSLRRGSTSHREANTGHSADRTAAAAAPPLTPPAQQVAASNNGNDEPFGQKDGKDVVDVGFGGGDMETESNPLVAQFLKENPVDRSPINKTPPASATLPDGATHSHHKPTASARSNKVRRSSSHREAPVTAQAAALATSTPQSSHHGHHSKAQAMLLQQPPLSHRGAAKSAGAGAGQQQESQPPQQQQSRYAFLRSKTTLDGLRKKPAILRNEEGLPYVSPLQRYEINLLFMEDVLKRGTSGRDEACTTARTLCESLTSFAFSITAAKRRTLEDADIYFDNRNGVMIEVSAREKKSRRRRGLEKAQELPGKLDHVSVVAYNVGMFAFHPNNHTAGGHNT